MLIFKSLGSQNNDERKLFVGGLAQEVNEEDLKEYFEKYGEVSQIDLKRNSPNGRSRGFAFVVLKDVETLNKALAQSHKIKGKDAIIERAFAKNVEPAQHGGFRGAFGVRGRNSANRGGFRGGRNRGGFRGGRGKRFGHGSGRALSTADRGGFRGGHQFVLNYNYA